MKQLLLLAAFTMALNVSSATDFLTNKTEIELNNMAFVIERSDTTKPKNKEVRVEKEIENGKEKIRVWINGKEVDENSAEFKKYGNTENKVKIKERKGQGGKEEKVIIIKKEVSENVIISDEEGENMEIDVDVNEIEGGKHKVIIKKKGKDGKEEVEEIIINEKGGSDVNVFKLEGDDKVLIKTKKIGTEDNINVDVKTEKDGKRKVIIKTIDDKGNEDIQEIIIDETALEGENDTRVIIKKNMTSDFDLDGVNPQDIKNVNVEKMDDGTTKIIIKTKDGKTIEKIMKQDGDVKVIKKKKKD